MFFVHSKKKVLIIDDDMGLHRQVRYRLEHHEDVHVIVAADGEKGIEQAISQNPDLIILDWMLPGIQGIEVLKQLRHTQTTKNTPILMLTGRNKIGEIEDVFDLGADAYLTKPFSLQKLGEKVSALLNLNNRR